jgi:hypothetical protein
MSFVRFVCDLCVYLCWCCPCRVDDRAVVEELGQRLRRAALKVGFLMKCGDKNKTWHRRWFILGMDCLGYFETDVVSSPLGACSGLGSARPPSYRARPRIWCALHFVSPFCLTACARSAP